MLLYIRRAWQHWQSERRLPGRIANTAPVACLYWLRLRLRWLLGSNFGDPGCIVQLPMLHGRYTYVLLFWLSLIYRRVVVVWDPSLRDICSLFSEGRLIFRLKRVSFVRDWTALGKALGAGGWDLVGTEQSVQQAPVRFRRCVVVHGDLAGRPLADSFLLPYTVHPSHLQFPIRCLRPEDEQRRIRVLFAGNTGFYRDAHFVERLYRVPSRDRCVQWLLATRRDAIRIDSLSERRKVFSDNSASVTLRLVICTSKGNPRHWFSELENADFFLCLPGSHMLMCHNVIEAMAIGCIPILCYRDWFVPALAEGITCLSYATVEDLDLAIDRALSMSAEEVVKLRRSVLEYYRSTLDPKRVSARLATEMQSRSRTNIYLNQEDCGTLCRADCESVLRRGGTLQASFCPRPD